MCTTGTAGYAILRYKGAKEALPSVPLPQPGSVAPWTPQQENKLVVMSSALLNRKDKSVAGGVYRQAMTKAGRCPPPPSPLLQPAAPAAAAAGRPPAAAVC